MVTRRLLLAWKLLHFSWRVRRTALWAELKPVLSRHISSILQPRNWLSAQTMSHGYSQPPALFQMATGYWLSQAVYVAAKLGVADLLKDGPKSCGFLAATMGVDQQALSRLMRASFAGYSAPPLLMTTASRDCKSFNVGSPRMGKSSASVSPGRGNESIPGLAYAPNRLRTAKKEPVLQPDINCRSFSRPTEDSSGITH